MNQFFATYRLIQIVDHMRGLARLREAKIRILNFWDTANSRKVTEFAGNDEAHWKEYQRLRSSTGSPRVLRLNRGERNKYWNQDDSGGAGDGIHILAPTAELTDAANKADDPNAHSYALWLQYGDFKVVLGGDCDEAAWKSIWKKYGANLRCNILKASHHGRASGFHTEAVKAMNPEYTIVSVGKKTQHRCFKPIPPLYKGKSVVDAMAREYCSDDSRQRTCDDYAAV